jgi:hypothetical protein
MILKCLSTSKNIYKGKKLWGKGVLGEFFPTKINKEGKEVFMNIWATKYGKEMEERIKEISEEINYPEFFLHVINHYAHICKDFYEDNKVCEMEEEDKRQITEF